jgi:Flp pilus assembly pilin Flp
MQMQTQKLNSLLKNTRGANLVEYILLVAVMAVLAIVVFQALGKSVTDKVGEQTTEINKKW